MYHKKSGFKLCHAERLRDWLKKLVLRAPTNQSKHPEFHQSKAKAKPMRDLSSKRFPALSERRRAD